MQTSTLKDAPPLFSMPRNSTGQEQFVTNADRLCELAYVEGDLGARKLVRQLWAHFHDFQATLHASADTIKLIDSYRVVFTHERVNEYAKIALVGQYLMAAHLVNMHLAPYINNIGTLVDFGCGAGKSTRGVEKSVRLGGTIIGVDVSQEFIDQARVLSSPPNHNPKVNYEYKKIIISDEEERIPLDNEIADAVTTTIVLQEFQTEALLRSALCEMGRIAKRGAKLAVVCVNDRITCQDFTTFTYAPFPQNATRTDNIRQCQSTVSKIVWDHDRHWSKDILIDGLRSGGWDNIKTEYPLATNDLRPYPEEPEIEWKDEVKFAPLLFITGTKI